MYFFLVIVRVEYTNSRRVVGVLLQVEIRGGRRCPTARPAEREQELDIRRALWNNAKALLLVLAQLDVLFLHAKGSSQFFAVCLPVFVPFEVRARLAEEFPAHLLELAGTEREVAGVISLRKDLPTCAMPKGIFCAWCAARF
jgi:hypothetical protein